MPSLLAKQAARARRAARLRGLRADLSLGEWSKTVEDFGGTCAYCGDGYWTLDHFVPLVDRGPSSIGNCVPSCERCNRLKGALSVDSLWFIPQEEGRN
jgi:5-methylcytosine-specific restriction endonuclease McrA